MPRPQATGDAPALRTPRLSGRPAGDIPRSGEAEQGCSLALRTNRWPNGRTPFTVGFVRRGSPTKKKQPVTWQSSSLLGGISFASLLLAALYAVESEIQSQTLGRQREVSLAAPS